LWVKYMNLEDLKTYITQYAPKARTILGRKIEPIGTEYDILEDVVTEVRRLKLAMRDVEIPGITRSWNENLIQAAVAYFKDKVKKDIMPVQFAKDDNLIIEPLYRPKIFNMSDFTITWSGLTPPATIDLLDLADTRGIQPTDRQGANNPNGYYSARPNTSSDRTIGNS